MDGAEPWQGQQLLEQERYLEEQQLKINALTTSKYLKQADVENPVLVTIKKVVMENVATPGEADKRRGVMYFEELDKGMVLNKTNLLRTAKALGSEETDDWLGKQMVLYVDENVEMAGEIVGGLRLRAPQQRLTRSVVDKAAALQPKPAADISYLDDDIPF